MQITLPLNPSDRRTDWGLLPAPSFYDRAGVPFRGEDITGPSRGAGKGAGGRKPLPEGRDLEAERITALADWLTADGVPALADFRADCLAKLRAEQDNGLRLLSLAGGRGWCAGRRVSIRGTGCAARAGRYVWGKRGVLPSDTSLEDAAGAAAGAMAAAVRAWHKVGPEHWQRARFVRYLFVVGWRAAFKALVDRGGTGEKADHQPVDPLEASQLAELHAASVRNWQADLSHTATLEAESEGVRRAAGRFIAGALKVKRAGTGAGAAQAARTARQRTVLLVHLVHGHSLQDAVRLAGFASGRAALESLRSGKVFEVLRRAAEVEWRKPMRRVKRQGFNGRTVDRWSVLPGFAHLRRAARAAGRRAGRAWRALARTQGLGLLQAPARNPKASARWRVHGGQLVQVEPAAVIAANAYNAALSLRRAAVARVLDTLRQAVSVRARLATAKAAHGAAFNDALAGMRRGWLR